MSARGGTRCNCDSTTRAACMHDGCDGLAHEELRLNRHQGAPAAEGLTEEERRVVADVQEHAAAWQGQGIVISPEGTAALASALDRLTLAPRPRTPEPDAASEDTKRLDWLDEHGHTIPLMCVVTAPYTWREAIDDARQRAAASDGEASDAK